MLPLVPKEYFEKIFQNTEQVYFLTIKPAPSKTDKMEDMMSYFNKKTRQYWIVKCRSERGFVHYHGLMKLDPGYDNMKVVQAITRKIQRDMGFVHISHVSSSLDLIYNYIRDKRNRGSEYIQTDYYKHEVL